MPSRPFPSGSNFERHGFFTRASVLFLVLIISASMIIIFSFLYLLFIFWRSLKRGAKTIPFDSSEPLKLQRFSYRELKKATNQFDSANIIGKGGSGTVFRGILSDGKLVAIKRLDTLSLQTEREFENELQVLGGLRSPFLVSLFGCCTEKSKRILVYEYMPNRSLQESLFSDGYSTLCWERRFQIVLDAARALEFLHNGCDPPVIHGDIKPSNVLLDSEFRAKISDFGLSRIKEEGEYVVDMFSQDLGRSQELWKSQELSGNLTAETPAIDAPPVETRTEVDFALALQASSLTKITDLCKTVKPLNLNENNMKGQSDKGKEVSNSDFSGDDMNDGMLSCKDEICRVDHSKELESNGYLVVDEAVDKNQQGRDWWWRQKGAGELCCKDYVNEWIGNQICPPTNPDWDEVKQTTPEKTCPKFSSPVESLEEVDESKFREPELETSDKRFQELKGEKDPKNKKKKMQEWWKEERLGELSDKGSKRDTSEAKWKKGLKRPHFDLGKRFYMLRKRGSAEDCLHEFDLHGEFSFRKGWKKKSHLSAGSEMYSGDLFSRELSSTTSMRGTLCYIAPELGGCGFLMEQADIYSLGVLILVIVSGRRPLHVLASPMKLEKANLISWCRQLAQIGNTLELVDERLGDDYKKDQASVCINLALACLQKTPELRPEIAEVVKILNGEMDLPPIPIEFSPSPSSKFYTRSKRKRKVSAEQAL